MPSIIQSHCSRSPMQTPDSPAGKAGAITAQLPATSITVALVDDDPAFSENLAALLERRGDIYCVGRYATAAEALRAIPQRPPDIVLMDIRLPGMDGIGCVRQLIKLCPALDILMLTAYEQSELIFNALAAGAVGYVLKQAPSAEIIAAICEAKSGGSPMTSHIARQVVRTFHQKEPAASEETRLAPRERQVLDLLAQGLYNKEIAAALGIGIGTVHTHIRRIYKKLHVRCRTEAVTKHLQS